MDSAAPSSRQQQGLARGRQSSPPCSATVVSSSLRPRGLGLAAALRAAACAKAADGVGVSESVGVAESAVAGFVYIDPMGDRALLDALVASSAASGRTLLDAALSEASPFAAPLRDLMRRQPDVIMFGKRNRHAEA